jgi:basic membrane lipoprotein Med (substrate-binding protein (PBP1-ABC) superfamily)
MIKKLLGAAALTAMMAVSAFAADDKPAIVFDIGGKFDKSFNESMFNGSEKFRRSANSPMKAIRRSSLLALRKLLPLKKSPRNIQN